MEIIRVKEFMDHLRDNNLVIVSRRDYENGENVAKAELAEMQKKLLKKDAIGVGQVVRAKLLKGYTSVNGIKLSKDFKEGEMYKNSKGHIMICTSAIKRINQL